MADFDYDNNDGPDIEVVRSIAAEMENAGKPSVMTDAERAEWQSWREQQEWLAEHQRRERERVQAEKAEAERLESERLVAVDRAERNRKLQDEMRQRSNRQMRDRQLADLHSHAIAQAQYRHTAVRANAFANQRQRLSSALDNAIATRCPPPPPEPTVVVVQEDDGSADFGSRNFDVQAWSKKPKPWFR